MKQILYTYKFRLKPDKNQEIFLNKHFGSVRFIYNYFLNHRKELYLKDKKSTNYNKQAALLTVLKKNQEMQWLREINSQSLQATLKNLDSAFNAFFKKRNKFPRFKAKKTKNSFNIPQNVYVENNKLIIPKQKNGIKIIQDRKIDGEIKQATISKNSSGKYFVAILVEKSIKIKNKTHKSIAVDLGIKDFLILSNGLKIKNHRFIKKYERQLKTNQQHLSRKVKGSNRWNKQRIKVAKIHEKISNSRNDLIHKITSKLINDFDTIFLEDLDIKSMMKNKSLSKLISDVSWGKFLDYLKYKSEWYDKEIIQIGRYYPSSKLCGSCGCTNHNLTLTDRIWTCPNCGEIHDRDLNAANNILKEGFRIKNMSAGTADYKHRAEIRLEKSLNGLESISNEVFKETV